MGSCWYEACSSSGLRRRHNLQALLESEQRGENPNGKIVLVVASKPGVYALERAANFGVESAVVSRKGLRQQRRF